MAVILISNSALALEIYDAQWCRKNGGTIEFDSEYNISFNCITYDVFNPPYAKRVYRAICTPYLSSVLNNETPQEIKLVGKYENRGVSILDEYNWRITENELTGHV